MEYIAFMAAIAHSEFDYIVQVIQEYDIGEYLIAAETTTEAHKETNGEHFHFVVQMNDKDYHKFSKRLFIDKYKLRGKAVKDKPRQYGRVKKIEDFNRMCAYTVKDGNIKTNMDAVTLQSFKDIAFKSKEKQDFRDKLMEFMTTKFYGYNNQWDIPVCPSFKHLGIAVIEYYRKEAIGLPVTKTQIEAHIRYYQMYVDKNIDSDTIFCQMFPFS